MPVSVLVQPGRLGYHRQAFMKLLIAVTCTYFEVPGTCWKGLEIVRT